LHRYIASSTACFFSGPAIAVLNPPDKAAAERMMLFKWGWFTDPLVWGDYPEAMKQHFGDTLPSFTAQEKQLLKGSADFVGVNTYTSRFIAPGEADGMVRATQQGTASHSTAAAAAVVGQQQRE
jgi:beta-glucosidase/6-phospho-beta-glucosidase/beta-galactosidase